MASAVGGKSNRACDSCIKKRATWYCAADDAFLCQDCDSSVHSANPLARRHERVRLKSTAASLKSLDFGSKENSVPSWHQGFTRKARTARHSKSHSKVEEETFRNPFLLVPEVGSDEISREDNEEAHPLYRVPVFDTLVTELCTSTNSNEEGSGTPAANGIQSKPSVLASCVAQDGECLQGFLSTDMDIVEFAADVESLLGRGLENESFVMEELGFMDTFLSGKKVKLEEEEKDKEHVDIDQIWNISKEPPEWSFGSDSPATCEEEDDKRLVTGKKDLKSKGGDHDSDHAANNRQKLLSLDYEAVITAWTSGGSAWTNGNRPDFDHAGCWHDYMDTCTGTQFRHTWDTLCLVGNPSTTDGGREARVSRYREKRRTRLFSKKIRYEVRKLNAEKRPRMKGRFVKRTRFAGPCFPVA